MDSVIAPNAKLRPANSRMSTTGCSSVSSQATNTANATTTITASVTMVGELNQSSSLPLSSITCRQPTHNTSMPRPTPSIGRLTVGVSRL
jgi:hypothetical protein